MVFTKVNNDGYLVAGHQDAIEEAKNIFNIISRSNVDIYSDKINTRLYNSIVCRIISSEFIKKHASDISGVNFVTITISLDTHTITITVGKIEINNKIEYLSDVFYK